MDLREQLLLEHSKANTNLIIDWIGDDSKRMKLLMDQFFCEEYRISQRAAMAVGDIARKHMKLMSPFIKPLVNNLDNTVHDAVIRNTVRIFQDIPIIPKNVEGPLYEKCFHYLTSMEYPTAIKVFSMTVLRRIAHKFPELIDELILAIEDQIPHGSTGLQNRGKKEISKLQKIKKELEA